MRGTLHGFAAALLGACALASCSYETSPISANATVTIRGHVDGVPKGTDVALLPGGALSDLLALATLPAGCIACFGPSGRTAHVDGDGDFRFTVKGSDTQTLFGGLRRLGVYVRDGGPGIDGAVARGGTVVDFAVRSEQVSLPAVQLWRAAPAVQVSGDDITVTPPAAPRGVSPAQLTVHLGDAADHELASATTAGAPVQLDARLLEDAPGRVWVTARTDVGDTERLVLGPSVALVGSRVPVSRGASCHTFAANRRTLPLSPCGLTDGDRADGDVVGPAESRCVDLNGDAESQCEVLTHTVEVDLPATDVHAIVLSGSRSGGDVEVSTDGRRFVRFGPAPRPGHGPPPPPADGPPPPTVIVGSAHGVVAVRIVGATPALTEVTVW